MSSAKRPKAVLWLTIVAAPGALAIETALRKLLFPAEFEEVREFLEPTLTPFGWGLAAFAAFGAALGLVVQRHVANRRLARLPDDATVDQRYREIFAVFLLTTAVPQIPALLSTFVFMFGASIWTVSTAIAFCSVGVVAQALRVPAMAENP